MTVYAPEKKAIIVRLPVGLGDRIKELAQMDGRSVNSWIVRTLDQAVDTHRARPVPAPMRF